MRSTRPASLGYKQNVKFFDKNLITTTTITSAKEHFESDYIP